MISEIETTRKNIFLKGIPQRPDRGFCLKQRKLFNELLVFYCWFFNEQGHHIATSNIEKKKELSFDLEVVVSGFGGDLVLASLCFRGQTCIETHSQTRLCVCVCAAIFLPFFP